MLSLAFRFEPLPAPAVDTSGLTRARATPPAATPEWQLAIDLIAAVSDIVDIDRKLFEEPALRAKMIDKCGDLLRTAHYDKDRYTAWAEEHCWKPDAETATG